MREHVLIVLSISKSPYIFLHTFGTWFVVPHTTDARASFAGSLQPDDDEDDDDDLGTPGAKTSKVDTIDYADDEDDEDGKDEM